jgi:hypothetical protein
MAAWRCKQEGTQLVDGVLSRGCAPQMELMSHAAARFADCPHCTADEALRDGTWTGPAMSSSRRAGDRC